MPIAVFIPMEVTRLFPVSLACVISIGFTYRATVPLLGIVVLAAFGRRLFPRHAR